MSAEPAPFIPPSSDETSIPPAPWRLFGTRPFFKLWLSQVFSSLGDWVAFFAILNITAQISNNSAAAVSLVIAVRMVPGFFLGTLGGVIVDRFDRRRVMVVCDLARVGLVCLLPFVGDLWSLVGISFALEIFTLLWGPAKDASVPQLVPEEKLATANALSLVASYGTFPLGGVVFAALAVVATWLGGFEALQSLRVDQEVVALWFDAVTYAVSAVIVLGLPIARRQKRTDRQQIIWTQTIQEIKEGIAFIRGDRFLRAIIFGLGGGIIGAGAMVPLGTVFAREVLGSVAQFGVLMAALGTGAAVGLFAMLPLQKRLPRDKVFEWTVMGAGVFLILAAMFSADGLSALMISATGACAGAAYVTGFTVIQETVSDEIRGRTFATLYAVVRLCLLFSLTISPLFADVYQWLVDTIGVGRITAGGFSYTFPGVRLALWAGGIVTILSGLYARHELRALRQERTVARHPSGSAAPPPPDQSDESGEPPIASSGG